MKIFFRYLAIIFIPIALILLATLALSNNLMKNSAREELLSEMKNKWEIMALFTGEGAPGEEYHRNISAISEDTGLRITIIDEEGSVLDDSYMHPADIPSMENHRTRPEVKDAGHKDEGYAIRRSATIGQDMFYYARRISGGRILRIAYPLTYVNSLTQGFLRQNVTISILLFLVIGLISAYLASRISIAVNSLNEITDRIDKGKHHVHFPRFQDPTMSKISGLIYRIYSLMRKEQKRIMEEQEKLSLTLSVLEEAIIFLDRDDRVVLFNEKARDYLGVPIQVQENIFQEIDDPQALTFINEVLQIGGYTSDKKSFRGRIYEAYCRPLTGGKLLVFSDVTEKEQYQSFKTELVGNISHELKTPLSMIMGYAETVLNDPDMEREILDRFLETIYSSSMRLNELIEDVIELHHLESIGQDFVVSKRTRFGDVVDAVKSLFGKIEDKDISIECMVTEACVSFEHMASILTNLVDNAVKYSTGANIDVKIRGDDGRITIEVADEGPAIPEEAYQRIFERFYTVSRSRTRAKSGTGLGLSIVKHISQIYQGNVTLAHNQRGGNTFTVVLYERPSGEE